MSGTAYASDAPRAIQMWLNFAAVNPGAEPTTVERAEAKHIQCVVCHRIVTKRHYRSVRVCSQTCAETALHAAARVGAKG